MISDIEVRKGDGTSIAQTELIDPFSYLDVPAE
jgi:hypothetical protein